MTASGFSYRTTKQGDVFIDHDGRHVVTLRSEAAERFLERVVAASADDAQLAMAKVIRIVPTQITGKSTGF